MHVGVVLCSINKSLLASRAPWPRAECEEQHLLLPSWNNSGDLLHTCNILSHLPLVVLSQMHYHAIIVTVYTLAEEQGKYAAARLLLPEQFLWQRELHYLHLIGFLYIAMETFLRMQFQLLLRFMQLFVCLFVYYLKGNLKDCDWRLIWDESCLIMARMQNCAHADACEHFFPAVADSLIASQQWPQLDSWEPELWEESTGGKVQPACSPLWDGRNYSGFPGGTFKVTSRIFMYFFFFLPPLFFILLFHACEIVPVEFHHTLDNRAGSFLLS